MRHSLTADTDGELHCRATLRYYDACRCVCVSQVILFIVAISLHGIDNPKNNWMIGPNSSTLIRMGAKNPYMMRYKAHIERFFSPIFLHSGIIHILVNLTIQLRMGLYLERRWGSIKFTCTYVGSGMVGIMMGCVLQPGTISVAASACVMGLIGAYLAQLTITWHKFDPFQLKVALFQCIFVLVVTTLEGTLMRHSLSKLSTLTHSLTRRVTRCCHRNRPELYRLERPHGRCCGWCRVRLLSLWQRVRAAEAHYRTARVARVVGHRVVVFLCRWHCTILHDHHSTRADHVIASATWMERGGFRLCSLVWLIVSS